jgi:hypothetical protein
MFLEQLDQYAARVPMYGDFDFMDISDPEDKP